MTVYFLFLLLKKSLYMLELTFSQRKLSTLTTLDLSAMELEYLLLPNVKNYLLKLQKTTALS